VSASITGSIGVERNGPLRIESGAIQVGYGAPIASEGLEVSELQSAVREAIEAGLRASA